MQVEYKTEKGTVLFVLQPKDASDLTYPKVGMVDLYFDKKIKSGVEEEDYISIGLPDIGFQLIGLTSGITEEQAKMMVDLDRYQLGCCRYKNYNSNNMENISPIDSFKSLMQHLQVYEVNPYKNAGLIPSYEQKIYREAQSRTGKWIVLFKPN